MRLANETSEVDDSIFVTSTVKLCCHGLLVALTGARTIPESTTEIAVIFPEVASGSPVTAYEAGVKGGSQKCRPDMTVSPLKCVLTGLKPGRSYPITATALAGSAEIDDAELLGYTLPEGESTFRIIKYYNILGENDPNFTFTY